MRSFLSVSTFVLAAVISAQQQDSKPWIVEGLVTSDAGPIAGATIRSDGPQRLGTISTDGKGHYTLKGSLPGNYSIRAGKDGFGDTKPRLIRVLSGTQVDAVDFQLVKEAIIAGRVLDADQNPIPGVMVEALAPAFHDAKRTFLPSGRATTDDLGEFRISDLAQGQYYVIVVPEFLHPHKRPPKIAKTPVRSPRQAIVRQTFYPNVQAPSGAAAIYLRWGEQREAVDVVLDRIGTFCMSGTVVSAWDNGPTSHASLFVSEAVPEYRVLVAIGPVKPGEEFEICGLPPGPYRIIADTWTEVTSAAFKITGYVAMDFAVSKSDVELGTLYPAAPMPLEGKVTIEGARSVDPVPEGLLVTLDRNGRPNFAGEKLSQHVRASGDFMLENLIVNDYILVLSGLPKGYYIREASQQGHDVLHNLVRPGRGDLRVLLGADGPAIAGNTVDKENQAVHDAIVILASKNQPNIVFSRQSDQNGQFQFNSGVPPGEYQLVALTGLYEGEDQNPEFVKAHMSEATEMVLDPKASQSVTLTVHPVR